MSYDAPITVEDGFFVGEDKTIRVVVYVDGHGPNDPDPQVEDITGWTLRWVLKTRASSATALITKDSPGGITITGVLGLAEIHVARADTDDFNPGNYVHALARVDAGAYRILAKGDVVLQKAAA